MSQGPRRADPRIRTGIEPHGIGVAARSNWIGKEAAAALNAAGIPTVSLSAKTRKVGVASLVFLGDEPVSAPGGATAK
jgi:hypothetical protein